jgi:hypothetical protein
MAKSVLSRRHRRLLGLALVAGLGILASCIARQNLTPPAVTGQAGLAQSMDTARIQVAGFGERRQAEAAFGFDILGAGLAPLQIQIDNHAAGLLKLIPRQTFLIDQDGQAWPLLTANQAYDRLARAGFPAPVPQPPDSPDSHTGFALDLALGEAAIPAAANRLRQSLATHGPRNPGIPGGQAASGILLFPGAEEARGIRSLRICYQQDGQTIVLTLPPSPAPAM